jgi:hypothetical protein
MRILDIAERSVPISRYADPSVPSGGLTTSIVAVTTDMQRAGRRLRLFLDRPVRAKRPDPRAVRAAAPGAGG